VKEAIEKKGDIDKELFKEKMIYHTSITSKMRIYIIIVLLYRNCY
jgi:hypothetical protein